MREGGLFKMLLQKYKTKDAKMEEEFNSVTLIQVVPMFVILGSCIGTAMAIILMERLVHSTYTRRKRRQLQYFH